MAKNHLLPDGITSNFKLIPVGVSNWAIVDPDDYELPAWIVRGYIDFGDLHSARRWLNWIERTYERGPIVLSSRAMIDVYEGNLDIAAERARNALEDKMPNRWGADAIMIRILLIQAVNRHESASALRVVRKAHPELFESSPRINAANITQYLTRCFGGVDSRGEVLIQQPEGIN